MHIINVFLEFFKMGAVTFGGGQAMLPILKRELVENLHWITMKQFLYFVSVSQVTPGPISVNMATFIGYEVDGILGAIAATTGVAMPSFIVITIIATSLKKFSNSALYKGFIAGIKPVIIALLIGAIHLIAKGGFHTVIPYIMATIAFFVFLKYKINVFLFLIVMGVMGILLIP